MLNFVLPIDVEYRFSRSFCPQVLWLNPPEIIHRIEWDYGMGQNMGRRDEVRRLMTMALKGPLTIAHQQVKFALLWQNRKLVPY